MEGELHGRGRRMVWCTRFSKEMKLLERLYRVKQVMKSAHNETVTLAVSHVRAWEPSSLSV